MEGFLSMRPVTFSAQKVLQPFYQNKILTKEQLLIHSGCSPMTAWRILTNHGYVTSYNFNAAYYTLADIPEFDELGLWSYRNIRFSVYGSLTNTITALVANSDSGLDACQLDDRLALNTRPTLTRLAVHNKLEREKIDNIYVYFDSEDKHKKSQRNRRLDEVKATRMQMALPEAERIIAVLVELGQYPELTVKQRSRRLRKKGVIISAGEIEHILDHYELKQKKKRSRS